MAITVSQEPEDYTPCFSPQIFTALSNQVAQPNFTYTVVVTDMITTENKTYQIPKRPDNYLVFDAATFAKSYLTSHYIPKNVYGWQQSDSIRKIRVNIGETYGSTPVYTAGSNIDYIVWNAAISHEEWPNYDPSDYVYTNPSDIVYLTPGYDDVTYENRSNFLYALTTSNLDIDAIRIRTYDESGNQINNSLIANPWTASTTYTDKYLAIDIGHKGLSNIASGDVSGSFPILTNAAFYYDVYDRYISGFGGGGSPIYTETLLKRYYIKCEHKHTVHTIHYLAKNGRFETIHFAKRSDQDFTADKNYYKQLTWEMTSGVYSYDPTSPQERISSVETKEKLRLSTDWLSQEMIDEYYEIISSPYCYLDLGTSNYRAVRCVSNSYKVNKKWNETLFSLQLDFELAHSNHSQI